MLLFFRQSPLVGFLGSTLPIEVCKQGVELVRSFLRGRRDQSFARCPFVRRMFLGFPGAGKTTLYRVLRGKGFSSRDTDVAVGHGQGEPLKYVLSCTNSRLRN